MKSATMNKKTELPQLSLSDAVQKDVEETSIAQDDNSCTFEKMPYGWLKIGLSFDLITKTIIIFAYFVYIFDVLSTDGVYLL